MLLLKLPKPGVSKLFATGARFSIVKVVGVNLFTYSNDNLRKFLEATLCFTFAFLFQFQHLKNVFGTFETSISHALEYSLNLFS